MPRPRKSTALAAFEGNPGKKAEPRFEPTYETLSIRDVPECLDEIGQQIWMDVGGALQGLGILQVVDANLFVRYCEIMSRWYSAQETVREEGEYITRMKPLTYMDGHKVLTVMKKDGAGNPTSEPELVVDTIKRHPALDDIMKLSESAQKIERELGLSPAARTALRVRDPMGLGDGIAREPGTEKPKTGGMSADPYDD